MAGFRLRAPEQDLLRVQAAEIQHPILRPVTLDAEQGLSPDEAAVLAPGRSLQLVLRGEF